MVSHIMVLPFSHLAFPWFAPGWPAPTHWISGPPSVTRRRAKPLKTFSDRVTSLGILVISVRSSRGRHHSHHDPENAQYTSSFPCPAFEDLGRASVLVTGPGVVPATDPSSSSGDVAVIPGAHLRFPP
ncbi:hypothetical protein C8J57DRAFT_1500617 [Mycena rebaudengoi]|nr:hypothetical protein C8J57DRAFT_1500617 [Mycena rebaudengoi]